MKLSKKEDQVDDIFTKVISKDQLNTLIGA